MSNSEHEHTLAVREKSAEMSVLTNEHRCNSHFAERVKESEREKGKENRSFEKTIKLNITENLLQQSCVIKLIIVFNLFLFKDDKQFLRTLFIH